MKKFAKAISFLSLSILLSSGSLFATKSGDPSTESSNRDSYVTITDVTGIGMELQSVKNLNSGDTFFAHIYAVASGEATLTFLQDDGETISENVLSLNEGRNLVKLRMGQFPAGLYFLKVNSEVGSTQKAVLIK